MLKQGQASSADMARTRKKNRQVSMSRRYVRKRAAVTLPMRQPRELPERGRYTGLPLLHFYHIVDALLLLLPQSIRTVYLYVQTPQDTN